MRNAENYSLLSDAMPRVRSVGRITPHSAHYGRMRTPVGNNSNNNYLRNFDELENSRPSTPPPITMDMMSRTTPNMQNNTHIRSVNNYGAEITRNSEPRTPNLNTHNNTNRTPNLNITNITNNRFQGTPGLDTAQLIARQEALSRSCTMLGAKVTESIGNLQEKIRHTEGNLPIQNASNPAAQHHITDNPQISDSPLLLAGNKTPNSLSNSRNKSLTASRKERLNRSGGFKNPDSYNADKYSVDNASSNANVTNVHDPLLASGFSSVNFSQAGYSSARHLNAHFTNNTATNTMCNTTAINAQFMSPNDSQMFNSIPNTPSCASSAPFPKYNDNNSKNNKAPAPLLMNKSGRNQERRPTPPPLRMPKETFGENNPTDNLHNLQEMSALKPRPLPVEEEEIMRSFLSGDGNRNNKMTFQPSPTGSIRSFNSQNNFMKMASPVKESVEKKKEKDENENENGFYFSSTENLNKTSSRYNAPGFVPISEFENNVQSPELNGDGENYNEESHNDDIVDDIVDIRNINEICGSENNEMPEFDGNDVLDVAEYFSKRRLDSKEYTANNTIDDTAALLASEDDTMLKMDQPLGKKNWNTSTKNITKKKTQPSFFRKKQEINTPKKTSPQKNSNNVKRSKSNPVTKITGFRNLFQSKLTKKTSQLSSTGGTGTITANQINVPNTNIRDARSLSSQKNNNIGSLSPVAQEKSVMNDSILNPDISANFSLAQYLPTNTDDISFNMGPNNSNPISRGASSSKGPPRSGALDIFGNSHSRKNTPVRKKDLHAAEEEKRKLEKSSSGKGFYRAGSTKDLKKPSTSTIAKESAKNKSEEHYADVPPESEGPQGSDAPNENNAKGSGDNLQDLIGQVAENQKALLELTTPSRARGEKTEKSERNEKSQFPSAIPSNITVQHPRYEEDDIVYQIDTSRIKKPYFEKVEMMNKIYDFHIDACGTVRIKEANRENPSDFFVTPTGLNCGLRKNLDKNSSPNNSTKIHDTRALTSPKLQQWHRFAAAKVMEIRKKTTKINLGVEGQYIASLYDNAPFPDFELAFEKADDNSSSSVVFKISEGRVLKLKGNSTEVAFPIEFLLEYNEEGDTFLVKDNFDPTVSEILSSKQYSYDFSNQNIETEVRIALEVYLEALRREKTDCFDNSIKLYSDCLEQIRKTDFKAMDFDLVHEQCLLAIANCGVVQ